jgi:hypothetical protein
MRNKTKKLFLALTLLLSLQWTGAQEKLSIDKVYKMSLRNAGTIIADEQVKGYYYFFMSDKIDKKTNEYTLQIVDANLNKIKDIKFQDSKKIVLLESSYNDASLVFMFYDDDQNMLDYRLYNMEGKQTGNYSKILDKRSEKYFKTVVSQQDDEEVENQNIFDIKEKGFLTITALRENKNYTYDVNFYSSDKKKTWTYNPIEDGKFTSAQYLGANDSVALIEVLSREKLMSKDMESTILGINLSNGKKAFEIRSQDGKYQLYPMNISTLKGGNTFLLIGPYYEGNDKVMKDKSDGIGIWEMTNQGKILRSKYNSWEKDMSKYLKIDQKGRVSDLGYVYFHNLQQTEDGKIFAIGEGYRKVADGLGIAMNVLSGSYSAAMTKLKITDMLMLTLSSNFELLSAQIYEKNNNNFSLNTGTDFLSPHSLAVVAKTYGAFDYTFTQMGKNHSSFTTAYTDYERTKDYKGLTFHAISYYDGKITTDKINLKSSAKSISVLPAKPGSVLIMEYFKKDKRLDMHMEKIN